MVNGRGMINMVTSYELNYIEIYKDGELIETIDH